MSPSPHPLQPLTAARRMLRQAQVPVKPTGACASAESALVSRESGSLISIPASLAEVPQQLGVVERLSAAECQAQQVATGAHRGELIRQAASVRLLSPSAVAAVRRGVADRGASLPEPIHRAAKQRIGMDFSEVRLHTGGQAAGSARAVGARAFAVGRHIVLGSERSDPASTAVAGPLMHELTHVAQQAMTGNVQLAREEDPDAKLPLGALDNPVVTAAVRPIVGETNWVVLREFLSGMWGGLLSAPPEQLARIQKKADDFGALQALKYAGGYALGIVEGLWDSVKGLVEAIWTLIKLPYTVLEFLTQILPALAAKYGPRIRQALTGADGLGARLRNLLTGFIQHPRDSLRQLRGLLDAAGSLALEQVRALGHAASGKLLTLLEEEWYDFGRDIGKIVGQILFEVILAVASEGIGTAVKSALRLTGELAARAVTGAVELLRDIGKLFGQALEWVQGIGRRLTGEAGELFEAVQELLRRLDKLFAEIVGDAAVADTGVGGVQLPIPETPVPTALESRAVKPPPSGSAADLPKGPQPRRSRQARRPRRDFTSNSQRNAQNGWHGLPRQSRTKRNGGIFRRGTGSDSAACTTSC